MSEFQFYVYNLVMRLTYVINTDSEEQDFEDQFDLLVEVLFLVMIFCSVLGAVMSIMTTGMIPFETTSITIFVAFMTFIYLTI